MKIWPRQTLTYVSPIYIRTILLFLVGMMAFMFILFFSPCVGLLVAGKILCGMPWGAFRAITTTYAADICPVSLRAYITTYGNLCFVMGQLRSTGVLRAFIERNHQWVHRIPFSLQRMWPVPILMRCFLAPESPWVACSTWLQERG